MGSAKGSFWIVSAALAALAIVVRAVGFESALPDGQAVPSIGDGWYHLRRIVYDAARLPMLLGFDPFVQFPEGARAAWPPLFDAVVAWMALPIAGAVGPGLVGNALWAPALIGALTVVCLYGLLQPRLGTAAALAAAALLAVLPAHVEVTRVGALSQRCAGGLVAVLALAATLRLLESDLRSRWAAVATGLVLGLGILVSTGGVLVAVAVQLVLLLIVVSRASVQNPVAIGHVLLVQVLALLVLLPAAALRAGPEADLFTAPYPSRAHLALFAVPCAIVLAWLPVWRYSPRRLQPPLMLGLAVLGVLAGWGLAPPVLA
ncbi:MAG: STT3 domain-containing protein, partial [Myxococcota bacterium]|nr:STT3 domain-containing protein [Myxococcota bacterium]